MQHLNLLFIIHLFIYLMFAKKSKLDGSVSWRKGILK